MQIEVINKSKTKLPLPFIRRWMTQLEKELGKTRLRNKQKLKGVLHLVFLDPKAARTINRQYRNKNYATDILTFDIGELIMCPQVIRRQAKEHGLGFEEELGYLLIHGVLHWLGYDHELSQKEANLMFAIQDRIFASILKRR